MSGCRRLTMPRPHSREYLSAFAAEGCSFNSNYYSVNDGISLLITRFIPAHPARFPAVVFIPGLLSGIENFKAVIKEFTRAFNLYIIETREKSSGQCPPDAAFTIQAMASDIAAVINCLGLKEKDYILLGYSMNASVIMESFLDLKGKPAFMVAVNPTPEFRFPKWSLRLARFIAPYYGLIKPFLKLYIGHFHVNRKEDPEMQRIQARVLNSADPYKLCATIQAIEGYSVWECLGSIDIPLLVIGASKDSLHNHDDALRLASTARNATYTDLETNERSHGGEVASAVREFSEKLGEVSEI